MARPPHRSRPSSVGSIGNRMALLQHSSTLSDQYERIVSRGSGCARSAGRCIDDDRARTYDCWRSQDLLEKRLLGMTTTSSRSTASNNDDEEESEAHLEARGAPSKFTAAVHEGDETSPRQSQHMATYNPLLGPLSSLPNIDGRWPLIATGTVLAISAIALSLYLSGGLAPSAAATAAVALSSSFTPASAVDKFHWLFRGGGAACNTASFYVTKRAIPSALRMLKKMAIMEVWRRVWIFTFHQMSAVAKKVSRGTVHMYKRYMPLWIRRGLQNVFKSTVQKAVHGTVGSWVGMAAGGASDFVAGVLSAQEAAVQEAVEDAVGTACGSVMEAIGSD